MRRISKWLIGIGAVAFLAVSALFVYQRLYDFWHRPLGPGLGFESSAVLDSQADVDQALSQNSESLGLLPGGAVPTKMPSHSPTNVPEPYCGGPEVLIVMAVGIDYRRDSYLYGLADVIKIVRVDFVAPSVTVLSIPRDLWIEVPDISDHYGITHTKLNQAYFFGTEGMGYYDGPGLGAGLLARTLELNFGIQPDHYGVINMATFEDIVNAVGGIDIYLPTSVSGEEGSTEGSKNFFPQGWNHLNGTEALQFARIRQEDTVFHRMDRQTQVMCALRNEVVSAEGILNLAQMINAFSGRVLTDLSLAQMGQMACLLPKLDAGGIVFASFPRELFVGGSVYDPYSQHYTFSWDVDFEVMREYVDKFLAGEWPGVGVQDGQEEGPGLSCEDF